MAIACAYGQRSIRAPAQMLRRIRTYIEPDCDTAPIPREAQWLQLWDLKCSLLFPAFSGKPFRTIACLRFHQPSTLYVCLPFNSWHNSLRLGTAVYVNC